jgi:hypothetical protein
LIFHIVLFAFIVASSTLGASASTVGFNLLLSGLPVLKSAFQLFLFADV